MDTKYRDLCLEYGVAWDKDSPKLVRETVESLVAKFVQDPYLNNVPLALWDSLALTFLAFNRGTGLTLGEAVVMQKCACILYICDLL